MTTKKKVCGHSQQRCSRDMAHSQYLYIRHC